MTGAYPVLERPNLGVGIDAKLFLTDKPDTGAKTLWLFKGDKGYELVSFIKFPGDPTLQLTKDQVIAVGKLADTRF